MVPEGWKRATLEELGDLLKGRGGPKKDDAEHGIPVIRYGELYTDHREVIRTFRRFVPLDKAPNYAPLREGDVVFASSGETAGEIGQAAVFLGPEPALTSGDTIVFRPGPDVDPHFMGYVSNGPEAKAHKRSSAQGSSVMHVYTRDLKSLELCLPPLPEQRKIAAILSSVDEAIAVTRRVIEQSERVKQGLLQTLMTRGIRHTRFKQTDIGEIPEAWEVVSLEDVAHRGSGHTPSKRHPEYWGGDIRWVSLADSASLDRVYISETDKTITEEGIANSSAVIHPSGTVLVSRDASVGRSAIATRDLAVSQHFIAWQCAPRLHNHFLYYWLQYQKPLFERMAVGSTIKTIGLRFFKTLKIPLPSMVEQERMVEILLGFERCMWNQEAEVDRLQTLKRGLMQDLLTGRVRVQPD
jgi:type I restriction enzyme, S subunit